MAESLAPIVDTLRGRVLRGLASRTLAVGDRLPSARTLAREFGVPFRAILNAYRALSDERLVTVRSRGGVYVAEQPVGPADGAPLPEAWITEVLSQGLARSIRPPELYEWLRQCTETLRLRALVIASTADRVDGLSRELSEDFGFVVDGLTGDRLPTTRPPDASIRRADLLVTTRPHAEAVRCLGCELGKPVTVIEVQPEFLSGDWTLLLLRPIYAVVATEEFGRMLRHALATVPGIDNLRVLVYGRDDVASIPKDAPTYVTQRVRASLDLATFPGRALPPPRTIRSESARELLAFVVRSNLRAISARAR